MNLNCEMNAVNSASIRIEETFSQTNPRVSSTRFFGFSLISIIIGIIIGIGIGIIIVIIFRGQISPMIPQNNWTMTTTTPIPENTQPQHTSTVLCADADCIWNPLETTTLS